MAEKTVRMRKNTYLVHLKRVAEEDEEVECPENVADGLIKVGWAEDPSIPPKQKRWQTRDRESK